MRRSSAKILPIIKAVRYLQIENKIRAVVKYEIASGVPLVKDDTRVQQRDSVSRKLSDKFHDANKDI